MSSSPATPAALASASDPYRLLLVNGNTTAALTGTLQAQADAFYGPAARVHAVTAEFGPAYIASRAEFAVAAHAVLQTVTTQVERAAEPYEACVLACFGEPGMGAVRERHGLPVVGMAESAILTALQLGERYAIVTVGARWPGMLREYVRQMGLQERCAGIHALPGQALDYVGYSAQSMANVDAALRAAMAQGADVVIAAGAALAGYVGRLPAALPVPVIDSYRAALAQALALAALGRSRRAA